MSSDDEKRRKRERDARAAGDLVGIAAEAARESRHLNGPYDHLIGEWCSIYGVRAHYRGKLLWVQYGPSNARLAFHPLYNMNDISTTQGEHKLASTEECPNVVNEFCIHDIGPQYEGLPKS